MKATASALPAPPKTPEGMEKAAEEARAFESGLREPQRLGLGEVYARWKEGKRALLNLPTGVGKTRAGLTIVARALIQGHRALWLAHREELLDQPLEAFCAGIPSLADRAGIVQGDRDGANKAFVIASVQTLDKPERMARVLAAGDFGLIVVDECHRSIGPQFQRVLEQLEGAGKPKMLGLTATLERGDRVSLGSYWDLAYSYPIRKAIEDGHLVEPLLEVLPVEGVDLDEVKERFRTDDEADEGGGYDLDAVGDYLLEHEIVPHTVVAIRDRGEGRKGVMFGCNVEQATLTAQALADAGLRAEVVHGKLSRSKRRALLGAHKAGELDILCNADLLTEGYDDPSISLVVLARPCRSKGLFLQILGRGLRLSPGKQDCLVLDLAGASQEHELFQAPSLVGRGAPAGRGAGLSGISAPPRLTFSGLFDAWERSRFAWFNVPGLDRRAYALEVGQAMFILVEQGGGVWRVVEAPRGKLAVVVAEKLTGEDAQSMGDELVRRAGAERIADKGAGWREPAPPSEAQIALVRRVSNVVPKTKAEATEILTRHFAFKRLVGARLATPRSA